MGGDHRPILLTSRRHFNNLFWTRVGETYYFCSKPCQEQFDQHPERYLKGLESRNL
ncbi:MAG: YHS domain-containing protein [Nitrospiraceae bacterium]